MITKPSSNTINALVSKQRKERENTFSTQKYFYSHCHKIIATSTINEYETELLNPAFNGFLTSQILYSTLLTKTCVQSYNCMS